MDSCLNQWPAALELLRLRVSEGVRDKAADASSAGALESAGFRRRLGHGIRNVWLSVSVKFH